MLALASVDNREGKLLWPQILPWGDSDFWNYQRMDYMILHNFYRNATFVFVLFWYVLYTGFTLTTAISEWNSVLYSAFREYLTPSDIQIAREMEKSQDFHDATDPEVQMNTLARA
ncbi:phospholipid-transporting ATPase 1-like [Phragmites australis]|uniref:phospholipid-transporting ATPase 1-like n=1 Tax=Phragmites australis TaxID=29695 RepID=UPI002D781FF2|nr:phospholipid-transporting ATPase 1-like [Phragmites australis]